MNNLESIVPPLDLCKQIPAEKFADSAMVWVDGIRDIDHKFVTVRTHSSEDYEEAPAPTLAEILEALDAMFDECDVCVWNTTAPGQWGAQVMDIGRTVNFYEYDSNPATAALRLWLEVEGAKYE